MVPRLGRPPARPLPPVSEEAPVGVAGAVAARGGAGRAFVFQRFPGKRGAVEGSFLLPAGCEGAPRGAPVRGVFATDVSKPNAARNRTPGHREKKIQHRNEEGWKENMDDEV